jgi:nucleotide-binding universal stress UspA family protein
VNSYSRILVAVDFSEPARAAFDYALALSRRGGARLLVVHAVTTDWPYRWHARERRALIASLRAAAKSAGIRFKIVVDSGDPASVIVQHADARHADVIVLGASERTGLDRFRFGSVAETVAVESTKPVLVIPAQAGRSADAGTPPRSILVAIDLNEGSTAAVARALSMAGDATRVTVVHVVPGVPLAGVSRYMYRVRELEFQRHLARDAWRKLPEIIRPTATSPKVHARVVMGDPASEIARVAREADADLVLVGVTPRGVIGRLLFGSTAARVIRHAGVPVLTMPAASEGVASIGDGEEYAVAA